METCAFYNHIAEAIVIAAIASDKDYAQNLVTQLTADDFHDMNHRRIFTGLKGIVAKGCSIDMASVAQCLGDAFTATYIDILTKHRMEAFTAKKQVSVLKELTMRRDMYKMLKDAQRKLEDEEQETGAVLEATRQSMRNLVTTGHTWLSMQDILLTSFEAVERRSKGVDKPVSSGIGSLDRLLTGFQRGELTVIGARPAVGKSALGMFIALSAAKKGHKVGLCSLEMTAEQYGMRILSAGSDVDNYKMRTGQLDAADWAHLSESMELNGSLDVSFMFTARMVEDLRMEVQNAVDTTGLDLLVIDYLQLLRSRQRFDKDYERIGYVSKMLKHMTIDFGIPIIALAQVGRSADGGMPSLSELRGSGEIEQDADNVLFMHRVADSGDKMLRGEDMQLFHALEEQGRQYIVIDVAKNRQGQTGTISVVFDPARMQYTTISRT